MGKLKRFLGLLPLVAVLSGCGTVAVQATVIDQENARFAIQGVFTQEAVEEFMDSMNQEVSVEGSFDFSGSFAMDSEGNVTDTSGLIGDWVAPSGDTLQITPTETLLGRNGEVFWRGDFTAPTITIENGYDWVSLSTVEGQKPGEFTFSYRSGALKYVTTDIQGNPLVITFSKVLPEEQPPTVEVTPGEPQTYTEEQLCTGFKTMVGFLMEFPASVTPELECADDGYVATAYYDVTYGYDGITGLNGEEISAEDKLLLPFKFYKDVVYQDVVFQHDIMGLRSDFVTSQEQWLQGITDYRVTLSFPGEITEISNDGVQTSDTSVEWGYDQIKAAVENGDYTIAAAGSITTYVDPKPILLSLGGVLFLLILLVYFSWKRIPARAVAITSFFLIPLSPFGLSLAIVARKKAPEETKERRLAFISIILNSAALVFEILFLVLLWFLAPELVQQILGALGLVSVIAS